MIAASKYTPNKIVDGNQKVGNLIFFISPHIGLAITQSEVIYGHTFRPGQIISSNCCGAMMAFLRHLRHAEKIEDVEKIIENNNDTMKDLLFKELLEEYSSDIQNLLKIFEMNKLAIEASKLNYKVIMSKFKSILQDFLEKHSFTGDFAIIGGITVNTVDLDYFIFRDFTLNSIPP